MTRSSRRVGLALIIAFAIQAMACEQTSRQNTNLADAPLPLLRNVESADYCRWLRSVVPVHHRPMKGAFDQLDYWVVTLNEAKDELAVLIESTEPTTSDYSITFDGGDTSLETLDLISREILGSESMIMVGQLFQLPQSHSKPIRLTVTRESRTIIDDDISVESGGHVEGDKR